MKIRDSKFGLALVVESSASVSCFHTVKTLCVGTNRSEQTVKTQIRLLLKEQSDQGLHCLPFHLYLLDEFLFLSHNLGRSSGHHR